MSRKVSLYSALVATALLAASLAGCGSGNKESAVAAADVAKVGDTACYQCHSATADPLTGETFIEQYKRSLHAELGCESCHGGGAEHNGIGPFPYTLNGEVSDAQKAARCAQCHDGVTQVTKLNGEVAVAPLSSSPNFENGNHANPFGAEEAHEAKCARCHSHEGSILYGKDGYTGDKGILDNTSYQPVLARDPETFNTIKCATCHEHGGNIRQNKTRDLAGNIVTWDPNRNKVIDQIDICTSCHTYTTNEGKLIGSGNVLSIDTTGAGTTFKNVSTAAFYHDTAWFRMIPSTHYDQPTSTANIEGYVLRTVAQTKTPCFDCHGHEFKANTRSFFDHPERGTTIQTDWAMSGHAGHLLDQKLAASKANGGATGTTRSKGQVDAVMKAGAVEATGAAWVHYDWDHTLNANGADDRGPCQMCHTSTGISNYLTNPTTYDYKNNDFTHLSGWKKATATAATVSSGQNEMLYCWGCHSNAGAGKLRATGSATLSFQVGGQPVVINNVGNSASCVVCHGGRGSVGELTAADSRSSRFQGHHAPTAGVMFASQTHIAFEYAGQNYTNAAFQHDKINSSTDGPCASCHMPNKKHAFHALSSAGGAVQKIYAQSLCNTCHGSLLTTTLDDSKAGFAQASTVLNNFVNNLAGFTNYLNNGAGLAITSGNYNTKNADGSFVVPDEAYGAYQNGKLNGDEPCAYVHNPTYAKRIVFDSIDWMDNGALNGTISFDATAFPKAAAWFGNATATGVTTFSRP